MVFDHKSGPFRKGDDWMGYFISGQSALNFSDFLASLAKHLNNDPNWDSEIFREAAIRELNMISEELTKVYEK